MIITAYATICNRKGLHARAAARLVKLAGGFDARIELIRPMPGNEPARAGATSILSLLMLAGEKGITIEIQGEGPEAHTAVPAIVALIERRFDEEE